MDLRRYLNKPDTAGIIAPPPLLYLAGWLAGWGLNKVYPLSLLPDSLTWPVGGVLIVWGALCGFFAFRAMRRARTPVDPFSPSTAIMVDGSYRYTRNPLYLALTLFYVGFTSIVNSVWPLVLLPLVLFVMHHGVIVREERYLEQKFGAAYLQYKAKVRRWL